MSIAGEANILAVVLATWKWVRLIAGRGRRVVLYVDIDAASFASRTVAARLGPHLGSSPKIGLLTCMTWVDRVVSASTVVGGRGRLIFD